MVGGTGLTGSSSTSQYIIVAQPGNSYLYYIFSPSEYTQSAGFRYAVVDMRSQNGLGEVLIRNQLLQASSTERVAAALHANRRDVWVIGHERNSDQFYAYLLSAQGLSLQPVRSRDGFVHQSVQVIGQLKVSPTGRKLALAASTINPQQTQGIPSVELLDFDPATGRITNPVILPPARITSYGVEFSPDGSKLYVTDPLWGGLFQYDLTSPNVASSVVQIPAPGSGSKSGLQLAPDGRIYLAHTNLSAQFLGVISDPNRLGAACAYVDQGISLGGRRATQGLPSFMAQDLWNFTVLGACQRHPVRFTFPAFYGADSVRWDFGDSTPILSASASMTATHIYQNPGRYLVSLTLYSSGGQPYTLRRYVDIAPLPRVNLGRDTALCPGNTLLLTPTVAGITSYRWQDNSTAATFMAQQPGWYWVDVTSAAGCTARDSLFITRALQPQIQLGMDTVVCIGQTLTLRPRLVQAGVRYRWQDGSTAATLTINQPGLYWVEGTNALGCSQRDSLRVYYLTPPTIHLGQDTALCQNSEKAFVLDATLPGVRYRWSDGSTNATFTPPQSGTYWVTVSTAFCSATDTIRLQIYDCRQAVFVPNIITPNGDGKNDELKIIGLDQGTWVLNIYNRWGKEVYQASDYQHSWNAANLPGGVYFYRLREIKTGQQVKGWIDVIR